MLKKNWAEKEVNDRRKTKQSIVVKSFLSKKVREVKEWWGGQ